MSSISKSIVDLRNYSVVLTTSFEVEHGISGHAFEMAEYFLFLNQHNVKTCILLSNGITKNTFLFAVTQKYVLSESELTQITTHTIEHFWPKLLLAKTLIIVDGSMDVGSSTLIADKILAFRCSTRRVEQLNQSNITVLQDYELYEPLPNSVHYKKKMLLNYLRPQPVKSDLHKTAMLYLTNTCRKLSNERVDEIVSKYRDTFDSFVAFVNTKKCYNDVTEYIVPVENMWEKFNTYIYTETPNFGDCSPRFVAECRHYNKEVIIETPVVPDGLKVRINDLNKNIVQLQPNDPIIDFV